MSVWRQQPRKSLMRSLQAVIAYSQSGAQEFRDLGFPAERVFVAPNAVTHRPAGPPVERPTSFAGRPAVLFVGRLQARKRVDHLLRACAACTMQSPRLMIVGDGPARAELEQLAQAVYPAAEFFGARHGAELAEIFNAADLFVLPGTGGLAVQEAMSYALPIIVAQGDGTQTDLVRPENGWLVPADDLPALTRTLQEALTAPKKLRQMGAASYRIVDQEVNLEKMVAVFLSALWSVSAETGPR